MPGVLAATADQITTYDVGFFSTAAIHHEHLEDIVTILSPSQVPFFSGAPKGRARDVVVSWGVEALAATSTAGTPEGVDFSVETDLTVPARRQNVCQIFERHVQVSDRERAANPAGIGDMYTHQIMKEFKVVSRNFESRAFATGSTATATGAEGTSTASRMASIEGLGITVSAASASGFFTGDILRLSTSMFENGAEPDSIWLAPVWKATFFNQVTAGGVGLITRNIAATDQRLIANIEVFESPMGQIMAIITDRFIPTNSASATTRSMYYLGDRSMARVYFFQRPYHKPMGKFGSHTRGIVGMDATIVLLHPSSWAAVTGLTATAIA